MKLTEALTDGIVNAIIQGTTIRRFPLKGEHATTENDRFYGSFIFIPVLVDSVDSKDAMRKMGKKATSNAQSATDGLSGVSAMFHQDPNELERGTITIRCFA